MGIYVQGYAPLPRERDDLAERLIAITRSWATERGLHDLFYASSNGAGAWLTFYPPAGGVAFEIESRSIAFGAKTSIAGPGFHVALIDLCDHLHATLGIGWRWDSGGDQTNYAVARSFNELRAAFLDQVLAYCKFHRDHVKTGGTHAINLSEGWAADDSKGVATPLGPVPGQLFLDALEDAGAERDLARQIFPWWSPTLDDGFWINTLRALLWTEVQWRVPRTPWESHVRRAALTIGERHRHLLDPALREAVDELASVPEDDETFIPPAQGGIGYLKRKRAFLIGGGWRINLPGYYIEQEEDDGDTICFWFGEEEIRASSFFKPPVNGQPANDFDWHEDLAGEPDRKDEGFIYRCDPDAKPSASCPGYSSIRAEFQARDADGNPQLLVLSIFGPKEDLVGRLDEIAKSLWHEQPSRASDGRAN